MRVITNISNNTLYNPKKMGSNWHRVLETIYKSCNLGGDFNLSCMDVVSYHDFGVSQLLDIDLKRLEKEINLKKNMHYLVKNRDNVTNVHLSYTVVYDSYFKLSDGGVLVLLQDIDYYTDTGCKNNEEGFNQFISLESATKKAVPDELYNLTTIEEIDKWYANLRKLNQLSKLSYYDFFKKIYEDTDYNWVCNLSKYLNLDSCFKSGVFDLKDFKCLIIYPA